MALFIWWEFNSQWGTSNSSTIFHFKYSGLNSIWMDQLEMLLKIFRNSICDDLTMATHSQNTFYMDKDVIHMQLRNKVYGGGGNTC